MDPPHSQMGRFQRLCYSIGHVQNDICASVWFSYLIVFFNLVLQWPKEVCGNVMLIGQVADALSTPLVGLKADVSGDFWMCRYGRRKTWHLIGTICVLLSFPFIFSPCIGCGDAEGDYSAEKLAYYGAFICLFQFGWAVVQISYLSLVPVLTPDQDTRTGMIACSYTFTVISSVFVYLVAFGVFHSSTESQGIGPGNKEGFQVLVASGLGVGLVCSILFHCVVKEPNTAHAVKEHSSQCSGDVNTAAPAKVHKTVKEFLLSVALYQVAAMYMSARMFANMSQVYTPLYLHELGLGADSLAIVPLVMFISSFLTSFIAKIINKHLGRKIAYAIGCLLGTAGCVWVWLGAGKIYTTYEVYAVAVLLGASTSIQLVTSLGLTADLIGQDTDTGAFVYGAMSFVDKLSNGAAVAILQSFFSRDYRNILAVVCGGATILGLLSVASLLVCRKRTPTSALDDATACKI